MDLKDLLKLNIDMEAWNIGIAMLKGILLEVSSYPKPGLVSSISMGSHKDMNILTFMTSSATIAPSFFICAQAGRNYEGEVSNLLTNIRKIGNWSEQELLKSTKGVNTQRGILFAGCILCTAAGFLSKFTPKIRNEDLFMIVAKMTSGIVDRELNNLSIDKQKLTAGEQLYLKYKVTGIRGEVESGFFSVKKVGLPALKEALMREVNLNYCLIHTLISLIAYVEDTTILWRKNMDTLYDVYEKAHEILSLGSVFTEQGIKKIYSLDKLFIEKNISPGGSADLLSITIAIYLLENGHFPVNII